MAKKLNFKVLSDKKCSNPNNNPKCQRFLKQRIVDTYPNASLCYSCSHPNRKANKIANRLKREKQPTPTIES